MNWVGGVKNRIKESFSRSRSRSSEKSIQKEYFAQQRQRFVSEPHTITRNSDSDSGEVSNQSTSEISLDIKGGKKSEKKTNKRESQDVLSFQARRNRKTGRQMKIRSVDLGAKRTQSDCEKGSGRVRNVEFPLSPKSSWSSHRPLSKISAMESNNPEPGDKEEVQKSKQEFSKPFRHEPSISSRIDTSVTVVELFGKPVKITNRGDMYAQDFNMAEEIAFLKPQQGPKPKQHTVKHSRKNIRETEKSLRQEESSIEQIEKTLGQEEKANKEIEKPSKQSEKPNKQSKKLQRLEERRFMKTEKVLLQLENQPGKAETTAIHAVQQARGTEKTRTHEQTGIKQSYSRYTMEGTPPRVHQFIVTSMAKTPTFDNF